MVHCCYMTAVLQFLKITLIFGHFVLLQILFCPPLAIDQSWSRLGNGHVTTASISLAS